MELLWVQQAIGSRKKVPLLPRAVHFALLLTLDWGEANLCCHCSPCSTSC